MGQYIDIIRNTVLTDNDKRTHIDDFIKVLNKKGVNVAIGNR